jgi:uncharacterized protein involved in outer membrane biogenesis
VGTRQHLGLVAQSKAVSRTIKGIGIGIGVLIAVLVLIIAFFPWNKLRGPVSRMLSADLGRTVTIAALHGSLFGHPHVQVSGFTIANPAWAGGGLMVSIQRIDLQLRFWPLLWGKVVLPRVTLIRPDVRLFRAADGRANWVFSARPESKQAKQEANQPMHLPLVHVLVIQGGKLNARDETRKITFDGRVDAGEASSAAAGLPSHTAKVVKAEAMSHGANAPARDSSYSARVSSTTSPSRCASAAARSSGRRLTNPTPLTCGWLRPTFASPPAVWCLIPSIWDSSR